MGTQVYLDWNASAPLCEAAKSAMTGAMEVVGNPSSVHFNGRAAKAILEKARSQISEAFGAEGADIVFTSGATEAAALALAGRDLQCCAVEHEAVVAWSQTSLKTDAAGHIVIEDAGSSTVQLANGETGVIQNLPDGLAVSDVTQGFGKLPVSFGWLGCDMAIMSAHKFGGPRGVGALVLKSGVEIVARNLGGGQEMGHRSGTENLIGIAGFGAAAEAAVKDLANGVWEQVSELRDLLEDAINANEADTLIVAKSSDRLPNTSCLVTPGWKGETQVMAMDLAGFSVSAGSACSSGKVTPSPVLQAMGYSEDESRSSLRVSLGPDTKEDDIRRFVETWSQANRRYRNKAA